MYSTMTSHGSLCGCVWSTILLITGSTIIFPGLALIAMSEKGRIAGIILLLLGLIMIAAGIAICCYMRRHRPSFSQGPVVSGYEPARQERTEEGQQNSWYSSQPREPLEPLNPKSTPFGQGVEPSAPPSYASVAEKGSL